MVGDAARLRQVLFNLAGNAIKFTEQRRRLDHRRAGAQPDAISIAVRDTGIGIAPQDQARIFLEFEQADGSSTRKFGGTGLGLTISNRIVESMGGSIAVESAPGQGSTFRVDRSAAARRRRRGAGARGARSCAAATFSSSRRLRSKRP